MNIDLGLSSTVTDATQIIATYRFCRGFVVLLGTFVVGAIISARHDRRVARRRAGHGRR